MSGDVQQEEEAGAQLGLDALEQCFRALSTAELARCATVCRSWRDVAARDALWEAAVRRELHRCRPRPRRARALFDYATAEPTMQHAAWQARLQSAAGLLSHWRTTALLHRGPPGQPGHDAGSSSGARGKPESAAPPPLRAWRCRATSVQRHEQSVWLRFALPPALASDPEVACGAREGRLEVRVEAYAPSGKWLPLIVSAPFRMHLTDDRAMLLQSHREGLYVWDTQEGAGAGGEASDDEEEGEPQAQAQAAAAGSAAPRSARAPVWWEVEPAHLAAADGAAGGPWADAPALPAGPSQQITGSGSREAGSGGPGQGAAEGAAAAAQGTGVGAGAPVAGEGAAPPPPSLRMLAYLHYEQLLAAVEGHLALPQTFPLRPRPHVPPLPAPGADAEPGPAAGRTPQPPALTLHLDFCALRQGRGLGRAVATLRLRRWGVAAVQYEAALGGGDGDVEVDAYGEGGGCTQGGGQSAAGGDGADDGPGTGWGESEEEQADDGGGGGQQQQQQQQVGGDEDAESGDELEAAAAAAAAAAGAAQADEPPAQGDQEAHLGAGELLARLVAGEAMADLALFDETGRLLVGRAGVELWQKEGTSLLPVDGGAAGEMVAVHRQLHTLHFLVDGLEDEELWDCVLSLDPAPQRQGGGRITLRLSWRALAGLHPQPSAAAADGEEAAGVEGAAA